MLEHTSISLQIQRRTAASFNLEPSVFYIHNPHPMFLNIVLTFPCPQSKRLEADMTVHLIDTSEVLSCQSWSTPGSSFSLTSHLTFLATRKLVSILQPASIDIKVPVLCCVNFNNSLLFLLH